jgi:hypothetical protein
MPITAEVVAATDETEHSRLRAAGFGSFAKYVVIGNFGDGAINIYAPDGISVGPLTVNNGGAQVIAGL